MKNANGIEHLHQCGTRAVVRGPSTFALAAYLVTCATCGTSKRQFADLGLAIAYCTDTSDRICSQCGDGSGAEMAS